jgi:hypothetical protein
LPPPRASTAITTAAAASFRISLTLGAPPDGLAPLTINDMSSLQAPTGLQPSASYSFTMRIDLRQLPGAFAQVAAAIGSEGAILGAIDLVRVDRRGVVRDVTVACIDAAHGSASSTRCGRWRA